jgi:hypothetical protein
MRLIEANMPSGVAGVDVMEISRPDGAGNLADPGLTLFEAKQLLAHVQQAIVAAQAGDLTALRPECSSCSGRRHVNGRRCHLLATPFGKATAQLPRFRCVSCGHIERCVTWPSHCRSTPELDQLRAHLSALMPFRVAADVLTHLLPADVGMLLTDEPARKKAKVAIVAEVERLHWRIWNGKAKDAQKTFDRIRRFMHLYKGERGHRTRGVAFRKLWHALHEIDKYLRSQSARLVNYAARHRVGTAVTEGTANFLVNRRMNKSQQMCWSRRGADLVPQARCAVYNGTLGSDFGQRFEPIGRPDAAVAIAA